MSKKRNHLAWVVLCLLIATCCALTLWMVVRHDQRLAIGEELLYDDFGFRVRSVREVDEVGPPDARLRSGPDGKFMIVRLEVENHARSVDYDMRNHRPVLEYHFGQSDFPGDFAEKDVHADGTRALAQETHAIDPPAKLRAGDFTSSDLVFAIPADAKDLKLRLKWAGEPMAGLDKAVFGDRTISLGR